METRVRTMTKFQNQLNAKLYTVVHSKFVMHHIGGRYGGRAFPIVLPFEPEFVSVMYEASTDGNEQILNYGRQKGTGETILVNACVGSPSVNRLFYLNQDPYTSSLLKLNSKYKNFYIDLEKYDYPFEQVISTHKEEFVTTESLDDLILHRGLPACDFLSVDTQGSELEILQHAGKTLANCVGIQLEVSFVEFYKDQMLFGDINKFLVSQGFNFVRFFNITEAAPLEVGIEFRGEKMQIQAEALYFKDPDSLSSAQYYPAIFTALAYGQTEYAMLISRNCKNLPKPLNGCGWSKFCDTFLDLSLSSINNRKTFGDVFSLEQSFARFVDGGSNRIKMFDTKTLIKIYGHLPLFLRRLILSLRKQILRIRANPLKPTEANPFKLTEANPLNPSEIELLFRSVVLPKVADSLNRSRNRK